MKAKELQQSAACALCKRKVLHAGVPLFWRVTIERFGIKLAAVKRQDGLTLMLGSPQLAEVMGPNEELTQPMMEPVKFTVCEDCAMREQLFPVAVLAETGGQR